MYFEGGETWRAAMHVVDRQLGEESATETCRVKAGRSQSPAERVRVPVEELLEPDGLAAAAERVRTESDVYQTGERLG